MQMPLSTYAYEQTAAPKQDKQNPQYRDHVPLIQKALQGTIKLQDKTITTDVGGLSAPSTARTSTDSHSRILKPKRDGTIRSFFEPAATGIPAENEVPAPALPAGCPWICKLRLVNPHSLCYINAGIIAMLYGLEVSQIPLGPMQFLYVLARKAAERGVALKLVQSYRFRTLVPEWNYNEEQRDTAEYIQQLLQAQRFHSVQWDARKLGVAGLQLRAQGDLPIPMPIRRTARNLQDVITDWHMQDDRHALAHDSACVCIQLNRFLQHGQECKLKKDIRFDRPVRVPIFVQHLQVTWCQYEVVSATIHIGRTTRSGHYRTLIKAGAQWMLTDDSCQAVPVDMNAELESTVYVLWLKRC
eukprot:s4608_g13.t1